MCFSALVAQGSCLVDKCFAGLKVSSGLLAKMLALLKPLVNKIHRNIILRVKKIALWNLNSYKSVLSYSLLFNLANKETFLLFCIIILLLSDNNIFSRVSRIVCIGDNLKMVIFLLILQCNSKCQFKEFTENEKIIWIIIKLNLIAKYWKCFGNIDVLRMSPRKKYSKIDFKTALFELYQSTH